MKSAKKMPVEPTMLQIKQVVSDGGGEFVIASAHIYLIETSWLTVSSEKWMKQRESGKKDVKNAGSSHDIYENKG
jgi:hypothetical protein